MPVAKNHPNDDADDVRLTLAGDRHAYGRLYDRHARRVRTIVAAVSNDFEGVEDLTQETFLRGHRRLRSLRDPGGFGPWIGGVARRVARERRRQLRRDRHAYGAPHESRLSDEAGPAVAAASKEMLEETLRLVADLPESERLAIHARFFHEQRPDEAAEAIGLSRSGYFAAVDRALKKLRSRLNAETSPREGQAE